MLHAAEELNSIRKIQCKHRLKIKFKIKLDLNAFEIRFNTKKKKISRQLNIFKKLKH